MAMSREAAPNLGANPENLSMSSQYRHAPSRHRGAQKETHSGNRSGFFPALGYLPSLGSSFRGAASISPSTPPAHAWRARRGGPGGDNSGAHEDQVVEALFEPEALLQKVLRAVEGSRVRRAHREPPSILSLGECV